VKKTANGFQTVRHGSAEDEFMTITKLNGRPSTGCTHIAFERGYARLNIPAEAIEVRRADWGWNGNGRLRIRLTDTGQFALTAMRGRTRSIATGSLEHTLNRELRGQFPITNIDGDDIYVDLEAATEELVTT
jgi:hypothetical protein